MRAIVFSAFLLAAATARAQLSWESRKLGLGPQGRPAEIAAKNADALPRAARYELFELYQRYIDTVNKRRDQHWRAGLLSGAIIEQADGPMIPVRQLEESTAKRRKELEQLELELKRARLSAVPVPARTKEQVREAALTDWTEPATAPQAAPWADTERAIKAKKKELRRFERQLGRSKGLAGDWSDSVWAELNKVEAEHWSITDQARTAGPSHRAAVACSPVQDPLVCFVFDPWNNAAPDVYEFKSWDDGSFDERVAPEYFLHRLPDTP